MLPDEDSAEAGAVSGAGAGAGAASKLETRLVSSLAGTLSFLQKVSGYSSALIRLRMTSSQSPFGTDAACVLLQDMGEDERIHI